MIIVTDYFLEYSEDGDFYRLKSKEKNCCPYCRDALKVIGSRRRVLFRRDGSVIRMVVRRLRCLGCGHIHHELPDVVIPYKRYEAEAVESALFPGTSGMDDYPCEHSTVLRQKIWFILFWSYMQQSSKAQRICLECRRRFMCGEMPVQMQNGWLPFLIRWAVNTAGWRHTRSA